MPEPVYTYCDHCQKRFFGRDWHTALQTYIDHLDTCEGFLKEFPNHVSGTYEAVASPHETVLIEVEPKKDSIPKERTKTSYYNRGNIEVVDFIYDQGLNFSLGNAVKYICRAGYKGQDWNSLESDLLKAINYLRIELEQRKKL
jgi:Protein of unknwon function (DUF3310)